MHELSTTVRRAAIALVALLTLVGGALALASPTDTLEHRVTSRNGRHIALATALDPGATTYQPGGRATTTIEVEDRLTGRSITRTFAANLEPEAFSSDGTRLYVIDHLPANNPEYYRVAGIDVATGDRFEVFGPHKQPLDEDMRGTGRQQLWSTDGSQLYTLYLRQYHSHDGTEGTDGERLRPPEAAFIHVLDVDLGWAVCLDLPVGFGLGPDSSTALLLGTDGYAVTAVDHQIGLRVNITRTDDFGNGLAGFEIAEPLRLAG